MGSTEKTGKLETNCGEGDSEKELTNKNMQDKVNIYNNYVMAYNYGYY